MPASPVIISIEGNIGSGKTTLLRALRTAHPEWHFVDEPVDQWLAMKNSNGVSLLELFYSDKRRWGYTFQNAALLTRVANLKKTLAALPATRLDVPTVVVMERSIDTDAHVFAKMLHDDGFIDRLEIELYTRWFETISADVPAADGYIHIDTPVTMCAERIRGRARDGEEAIPMEYLDKLDSAHFAWLRRYDFPASVLRYDNYSVTPKEHTTLKDVEDWVQRLWLHRVD